MNLNEIVAANLRRIRHERQLTQEELAHRAGLSPRYVGSIERTRVSISITILGRLAETLGIDPRELLRPIA
ncbi:MAG: helix-turn-helix transcriptional regulator [Phyllobacteriaceae bacterium]|nr:helix-turn-helix transcriptional regulator [Phyllobacteriaceae bacterium]